MKTKNQKSKIKNQKSATRSFHSSFVIRHSSFRTAFTLMELMVSVTILIAVILAINISFSGASKAVTSSQATMELMANVRATQQLLERDLRGIDKNSFLVIRSRMADVSKGDASYRFDQLSFITLGQFQNPTGADNSTNPFTDSSTASAAQVWWGQLIMEKNAPPDSSYNVAGASGPNQQLATPQNQLPTGAVPNGSGPPIIHEGEFVLGHHLTLLFPGPISGATISPAGQAIVAYSQVYPSTPATAISAPAVTGYDGTAHISSSRYAVAAQTPAQIMQLVVAARAGNTTFFSPIDPEADLLTYRFRALQSVYDTEVNTSPFVNGVYRMAPVVMAGVSSFKVEWTDGAVYSPADPHNSSGLLTGQLKWYGPTQLAGGAPDPNGVNFGNDGTAIDPAIEQYVNSQAGNANGDQYIATFSYFNRSRWPKALRFTYHVYGDRLGGRDIVQVVNLPQ